MKNSEKSKTTVTNRNLTHRKVRKAASVDMFLQITLVFCVSLLDTLFACFGFQNGTKTLLHFHHQNFTIHRIHDLQHGNWAPSSKNVQCTNMKFIFLKDLDFLQDGQTKLYQPIHSTFKDQSWTRKPKPTEEVNFTVKWDNRSQKNNTNGASNIFSGMKLA